MIHVAHVTASPCPDKDLFQRLASAMHSRDRRSIKWRGKEKMAKREGEGSEELAKTWSSRSRNRSWGSVTRRRMRLHVQSLSDVFRIVMKLFYDLNKNKRGKCGKRGREAGRERLLQASQRSIERSIVRYAQWFRESSVTKWRWFQFALLRESFD